MTNLCMHCGLLYEPQTPKKKLFGKKDDNIIKCPYCSNKFSIDVSDTEDVAPYIMKLREHDLKPIGHSLEIDCQTGTYSMKFFLNQGYGAFVELFKQHGQSLSFFSVHPAPISEGDDRYVLEANFKFETNEHKEGHFASFDYTWKQAAVTLEFASILTMIDFNRRNQ